MATTTKIKVGWAQINNAVCPYLIRFSPNGTPQRLVPLLVLKHGAQISFSQIPSSVLATKVERRVLNEMCAKVGMEFLFREGTELVNLSQVFKFSKDKVYVSELSFTDPFGSAKIRPEFCYQIQPISEGVTVDQKVPTVVMDFQSTSKHIPPARESSMVDGRHSPPKDEGPVDGATDKQVLSSKTKRDVKTSNAGSPSFQRNRVEGLQYVTVFKTKLLCIVKQIGKYILLEDLYKAFFSKWSANTFYFMFSDILRCSLDTLTQNDVDTVEKLSGESRLHVKVIKLQDAQTILPKVKALLKKIPTHVDLTCKTSGTNGKVLPKLSVIMSQDDPISARGGLKQTIPERDVMESKSLWNGIGAKYQKDVMKHISKPAALNDRESSSDGQSLGQTQIKTQTSCSKIINKSINGLKMNVSSGRILKKAKKCRNLQAVLDKLSKRRPT